MASPGGGSHVTAAGRFDERRARDAESRALATQEFVRPVVIEAGAGTGKTATLVARILAWCLGPGWDRVRREDAEASDDAVAERVLRGVVAITFTEAAAAEMDARTDAALASLARGEPPAGFAGEAPLQRVAPLRRALDHLSVQTIHGYCRGLLAGHPLEAGLHPLFEVDADGSALGRAAREAVSELASAAYAADDEDWLFLAERGIGPGELEAEVVRAKGGGVRARDLAESPLRQAAIADLAQRGARATEALAAALGGAFDSGGARLRKAQAVAAALAGPSMSCDARAATEVDSWIQGELDRWSTTARNAISDWSRGKFSGSEAEALAARVEAVQRAAQNLDAVLKHFDRIDAVGVERLVRVMAPLLERVEEKLHRAGRVGFEELLERTARLLGAEPGVAARLRSGLDQLLVDEFQDTDPRQCAIVEALALSGAAEERPGLFLVGDPKQSIYGWRNADLAAYEAMLAKVAAAGGRRGHLCVNFRSVPAVLDEVERVMETRMRREPGIQPSFEGLAPRSAAEGSDGFQSRRHAEVEYWVTQGPVGEAGIARVRASDAARIEAAALAADLRSLHDDYGVAWSDIGLLFRSRGDWDVYLAALRAAGVPFRVEGDRTYYRRREILDAAALVACVLDPNDGVAALATLRSSLAAVPDAAWIPLWAGGWPELFARLGEDAEALEGSRRLLREVAATLSDAAGSADGGWSEAAVAFVETVAALRRAFAGEAGDLFVEKLRGATGLEASESARFLGRWRVANLEHFFDGLAAQLADPARPLSEVLRELRRGVAEEETPSVEPAPVDATDAVSVVTLHGAKGLDWDHVYLMQLHKGDAGGARPGEIGRVDGRLEARWLEFPTLGYDLLEGTRRRVAEAERVRTLYVGMTRAKRRLVLCGAWPETLQRGAAGSHTALLAGRAGFDFAEAASRAEGEDGFLDAGGARWRFLGAAPVRSEAVAMEPGPESLAPAGPRSAVPADRSLRCVSQSISASVRPSQESDPEGDPIASEPEGEPRDGARLGQAIHAALARLDLDVDDAAGWQSAWGGGRWLPGRPRSRAAGASPEVLEEALGSLGAPSRTDLWLRDSSRCVARCSPVSSPCFCPCRQMRPPSSRWGVSTLLIDAPGAGITVVDYKSDRREEGGGVPEAYRRQLFLYGEAVRAAVGLDRLPRLEVLVASLRGGRRRGGAFGASGAPCRRAQVGAGRS